MRSSTCMSVMNISRPAGFMDLSALIVSPPASASPGIRAPGDCACNRKEEKSDAHSGCLTDPRTRPPVALTTSAASFSNEALNASSAVRKNQSLPPCSTMEPPVPLASATVSYGSLPRHPDHRYRSTGRTCQCRGIGSLGKSLPPSTVEIDPMQSDGINECRVTIYDCSRDFTADDSGVVVLMRKIACGIQNRYDTSA